MDEKQYFICECPGDWYNNLCQCRPNLKSGRVACKTVPTTETVISMACGVIHVAAIILGVILAIG